MDRCCTRRGRGTVRHNAEAPILYKTLSICTGVVLYKEGTGHGETQFVRASSGKGANYKKALILKKPSNKKR
jgi:hypothetical protein